MTDTTDTESASQGAGNPRAANIVRAKHLAALFVPPAAAALVPWWCLSVAIAVVHASAVVYVQQKDKVCKMGEEEDRLRGRPHNPGRASERLRELVGWRGVSAICALSLIALGLGPHAAIYGAP